MKLLFHTCCAPCSIQCAETLTAGQIQPTLFWYNPNIHPYTEYRSRCDSLKAFAGEKNIPLIIEGDYALRPFVRAAEGLTPMSQRCAFCYRLRLGKAAQYASLHGYDAFSTTLLISPYQNHELIQQTGEEMAALYGSDFFYRDFRPLFRQGQNDARAAGYYMQKYCGCIFSEEERYCPPK